MFGSIIQDMVIDMNEARLNTVGQLVTFLEGTPDVDFRSQGNDAECYGFIGSVVARFAYRRLRRVDKGVVMRYLCPDDRLLAAATHAADRPARLLGVGSRSSGPAVAISRAARARSGTRRARARYHARGGRHENVTHQTTQAPPASGIVAFAPPASTAEEATDADPVYGRERDH